LIEQWHQLVVCHHAFHEDRLLALEEAEVVAQRLEERESVLLPREEAVVSETARLAAEKDLLQRRRGALEAWQSRLTIQATEAQARMAVLQDEVRAHSEATQTITQRQKRLRRLQLRRWGIEVDTLRSARQAAEDSRNRYLALVEELQAAQTEMAEEKQLVAAETLALEQLRYEMRGASSPASEKRLEQLRRHLRTVLDNAGAQHERQARALAAESTRLEEQARTLKRTEERLLGRQRKAAKQQTRQDAERAQASDIRDQLSAQLQALQAQHAADEMRLAALHDEVERLAGILLEDSPMAAKQAPPQTQAA
jgi:chromosome segregation ATPase